MAFSAARKKTFVAVIVVALSIAGILAWQDRLQPALLSGFASGNGRLEAVEVDVVTKLPGRLSELAPQEGDRVEKGQIVARLDMPELAAQYRAALSSIEQARHARQAAQEGVRSAQSQLHLAKASLQRSEQLVKRGFLSPLQLDRDQNSVQSAAAALAGTQQRMHEAEDAQAAATENAASIKATLDNATLTAPIAGRVLYRLAEPGEVLGAGGKALTLVDTDNMYLTIFLPADQAGKAAIGSEGRIRLDGLPDQMIPATVSFVSPRNQFTPKEVETRNEREKLMFRVKLRINADWLTKYHDLAKPGMAGIGYLRLDAEQPWPARLPAR